MSVYYHEHPDLLLREADREMAIYSAAQYSIYVPQIDYNSIAEIYDLYVIADYDLSFFIAELHGVDGPVLELASGTGRLSIPLIEAGARLTCVDISQGMLDTLRRKLSQRGLEAEVHCMDICRLELPPVYDLVLLPFQAFMEIVGRENQQAALASVFAALAPGGRFICTLHNPVIRRRQVDGLLRVVGRFPAGDDILVVSGFETGGNPVVQRLQFFELFGSDGALLWKRMLPMEFEFIERDDFEAMASEAGFHVVDLYGDYRRSSFDPVNSPVMIWILEKKDL